MTASITLDPPAVRPAAAAATPVATTSPAPTVPVDPPAPIAIATDRCKGCELCVRACPKEVLSLDTSIVNVLGHHPVRLVDAARCTSCALCARVCPDAVFTIYRPERRP